MTAFLPRITALADRRAKLSALLLGLVSATGFAPLNLWPLTLLALAGWMALIARSGGGWRAFGIGWAFGVGHFALGLNWIATAFTYQAAMPAWLGWAAVLLLSLYLAVYPALAAWGAWAVQKFVAPAKAGAASGLSGADGQSPIAAPAFAGATLSFILAFAALWTLTEWLRSWMFTGFAWNPLGVILAPTEVLPLLSKWIGTYGLSGFAIYLAGELITFAQLRRSKAAPNVKLYTTTIVVLLVLFAVAPWVRQPDHPLAELGTIPITVVQPNIGQEDKWEGGKADANFAKLARLTVPKDGAPRLILWPEAAIPDYLETGYPPFYYDRSPAEARGRLTSLMNAHDLMLLGALKLELDGTGEAVGARNAVMTVHADGRLGPRYDKAHLVPYGEYLPMRPLLSAIGLSRLAPGDIDFWPGPGARTLDLGRFGQAGLQICYEIIFSGQVVDRAHRPDFIFNPSNDAWFGAWGPPQHLAQARLRAIEEGLPVVRATPTGISAVIDADGRILESIPMHQAGRIDTLMPRPHAATPFARYGNALSVGFALLLLALAIAFRRRGR
ncbi:apolipoprotein N-acyltransferase [Sphingopyxis sp. GW247-27LB]|uniref:apolipoprotein N-acyltransferase n=1 Tax=Sphingopyxis sp. GW247-27LB TaxID=2012632 RepID=UPI000BA7CBCA|nr:apolipoprotein N-acyltransferase [Sphingopyxis sp. GW247-27LB]PAL22494.1 apolipoprotein N-acyltransferase [Sphingopyxis sp. GW247-27LB]